MIGLCIAALPALAAASSQASTSQPALITGIIVTEGKVFFNLDSARTARPACATMSTRWAFNAATAQGQAMLSTLLSFKAMGKPVIVQGTGACPDWSDTETVQYLFE